MTDKETSEAVARKLKLQKHLAYKREARKRYAVKYPEKVRARLLIGDAIRQGFIDPPENSKNWHNKWDFHHPDHSMPYLGVWLSRKDHRLVEHKKIMCPPVTDYKDQIKKRLLEKWGML